jgi:hypothetical protein
MKTEYEKMLAGELYDGRDEVLMQMRINARALMQEYNQTAYDVKQREVLLQKMLGKIGNFADIQHHSLLIMERTLKLAITFLQTIIAFFLIAIL